MLRTGREAQSATFARQLLGHYHPDIGLDQYVAVRTLKGHIEKAVAALDQRGETSEEQHDLLLVQEHAGAFFSELKQSFLLVKTNQHRMELEAQERLSRLTATPADDLRRDPCPLYDVYAKLRMLDDYRRLNVAGFAKILQKFSLRVAQRSLELQEKVRKADAIIADSVVSVPVFPCAEAQERVAAMLSVVSDRTLEDSLATLDQRVAATPAFVDRIPAVTTCLHYRFRPHHQQIQGNFAAKVLAGTSHKTLTKHICQVMRTSGNVDATLGRFSNGEVSIRFNEAVRSDDVYVVQTMSPPVAGPPDNNSSSAGQTKKKKGGDTTVSGAIMELLLSLQTARLASCARLTAVVPYMAYSKRTEEIAALAEMLEAAGCQRLVTVDLFADQVEGMFRIPVDNISAIDELVHYVLTQFRARGHAMTNLVAVSPNAENVARARTFADRMMKLGGLDSETQFIGVASALRKAAPGCAASFVASTTSSPRAKGSPPSGLARTVGDSCDGGVVEMAGTVAGKECLLIDNVVDEAVTVTHVAADLMHRGATGVKLIATHGLFSGDATQRLKDSVINEVIVTDTVDRIELLRDPVLARKLRFVSVAPMLAGVIDCVHSDINAVSELLEK